MKLRLKNYAKLRRCKTPTRRSLLCQCVGVNYMNSDTFKDRLQLIIGDGSNRSFAEKCEVSEGTVRRYLRGDAFPPLDTLEIMARVGECRLGWLASGEGPMKLDDAHQVTENHLHYADAADLEKEYVLVPRYNVKVSAGGGSLVENEQIVDHLAFKSVWIRTVMHLNPANLLLVSAMGDSMYPTIRQGDMLLVDKGQQEVRDDAIYVLQYDGILVAKRLQKLYDGSVQIKSDNKVYDTQLVPFDRVDRLNVIGRVVWCGGKM